MNIINEKKSFTLTFADGGPIRKGDEGKSAYEIALDQGFVGTEEEWLASLKGEKGEKGEKGDRGEKGLDGKDGEGTFALFDCAVPITLSQMSLGEAEERVLRIPYGSERPLVSLSIRGGCTQTDVSLPDNHPKLIRCGEDGAVTVRIEGENEEKTVTLPLSSGLAATGEDGVYDEIILSSDGSGKIIRRCGFKVYDGTEEMSYKPNYDIHRFELKGVNDAAPNGRTYASLSSHYSYVSGEIKDYQQRIHSSQAIWAIQHPGYTDVASYRAYLAAEYAAGTPVTVCYRLAEPREETLTEEQIAALKQIIFYKGENRVTNSGNTDMNVTYTADTESYIEVKLAELKEWIENELRMLEIKWGLSSQQT